jgi:hypothetical protein
MSELHEPDTNDPNEENDEEIVKEMNVELVDKPCKSARIAAGMRSSEKLKLITNVSALERGNYLKNGMLLSQYSRKMRNQRRSC